MAEFSNVITTTAGFHLIELSIAMGQPLIFTKVELGKGLNTDTAGQTALIDKTMEAPISRAAEVENADVSESRVALYFAYSNDAVETGYNITELGIWAKVASADYSDTGWGGYAGEEQFFGYAYADTADKGAWVPDKTHKMDVQEFAVYASVGNATSVGVQINSSQYTRLEDFEFHVTDPDAHSDFTGCTDTTAGVRGFVPAPAKGDTEKFLSAQGGWAKAKMTPLELVNILYPKGIILPFENSTDPNEVWPGTTWERTLQGRVPIGAGDYWENGTKYSYAVGDTGGEAKHTLTAGEMPSHTHSASSSTTGAHYHGMWGDDGGNPFGLYDSNLNHAGSRNMDWNNPLGRTSTDGNHSHTISIGSTGGNGSHENRQPYSVVNFWRRTA